MDDEAPAAGEHLLDAAEATRLQQYEIVWIAPSQYSLAGCAEGFGTPEDFALEIVDFLGPGDLDERGQLTVWVRGPVVQAAVISHGVRLVRGEVVTVSIPHDQPRAARTEGLVLPPPGRS
jgi:hypothetical protein